MTPELATSLGADLCPVGLPLITARMLNDAGALRRMREAGAVHHVNMGGRETGWLLTRYGDVARALVDQRLMGDPPQFWSTRRASTANLLDEEDLFFLPEEEHARLRILIARQLTNRRVAALTARIQGQVDALLDAIPASGPVDFVAAFARPLPVGVLCELLDLPARGRRYIRDYVFGWIAEAGAASPATDEAGIAIAGYLMDLVVRRRATPGDDLISAMVSTAGTTDDDVLSAVRLLLVAGHRPVTRLLAEGVVTLQREPDRWRRLVADPATVDTTVEELLRVVTPTSLSSRYTRESIEIDGVTLPAGAGVHCALGAVNRDPDRFDDPDTFDPGRAAIPHLSFGLGRKHCLGMALARAQARIAFGTLARRFPRLRLIRDEPRSSGRLIVAM